MYEFLGRVLDKLRDTDVRMDPLCGNRESTVWLYSLGELQRDAFLKHRAALVKEAWVALRNLIGYVP